MNMQVTKQSRISGKISSMDLDITSEQLDRVNLGIELIQNIVPHLSSEEREFLITGITPDEWNELFN
jgi:hypothetical protein